MTWAGSKITTSGFMAIFQDFAVTEPLKDEELDIWSCIVNSQSIRAKTLVDLSRKVIASLAAGVQHDS